MGILLELIIVVHIQIMLILEVPYLLQQTRINHLEKAWPSIRLYHSVVMENYMLGIRVMYH